MASVKRNALSCLKTTNVLSHLKTTIFLGLPPSGTARRNEVVAGNEWPQKTGILRQEGISRVCPLDRSSLSTSDLDESVKDLRDRLGGYRCATAGAVMPRIQPRSSAEPIFPLLQPLSPLLAFPSRDTRSLFFASVSHASWSPFSPSPLLHPAQRDWRHSQLFSSSSKSTSSGVIVPEKKSGQGEKEASENRAMGEVEKEGIENERMDEGEAEEEVRKTGWWLKALATVVLTYVGVNIVPHMGDSMVTQSVALLKTKEPIFQRSGASRLSHIATSEKRRQKIVEAGGVKGLQRLLDTSDDERTLTEVLRALGKLAQSDHAVEVMRAAGIRARVSTIAATAADGSPMQEEASLLAKRLVEIPVKPSDGDDKKQSSSISTEAESGSPHQQALKGVL